MRQASRCRMQRVRNAQFHSRLYSARPLARQLTGEYRVVWLWGTNYPREKNPLYPGRYLTAISKLRLGILTVTEQGEGP